MMSLFLLLLVALTFQNVHSSCDCQWYREGPYHGELKPVGLCLNSYGTIKKAECVLNVTSNEMELQETIYTDLACTVPNTEWGDPTTVYRQNQMYGYIFNCDSTTTCDYAIVDIYGNSGDTSANECIKDTSTHTGHMAYVLDCCMINEYHDGNDMGSFVQTCNTDSVGDYLETFTYNTQTNTQCTEPEPNLSMDYKPFSKSFASQWDACLQDIGATGNTYTEVICPVGHTYTTTGTTSTTADKTTATDTHTTTEDPGTTRNGHTTEEPGTTTTEDTGTTSNGHSYTSTTRYNDDTSTTRYDGTSTTDSDTTRYDDTISTEEPGTTSNGHSSISTTIYDDDTSTTRYDDTASTTRNGDNTATKDDHDTLTTRDDDGSISTTEYDDGSSTPSPTSTTRLAVHTKDPASGSIYGVIINIFTVVTFVLFIQY